MQMAITPNTMRPTQIADVFIAVPSSPSVRINCADLQYSSFEMRYPGRNVSRPMFESDLNQPVAQKSPAPQKGPGFFAVDFEKSMPPMPPVGSPTGAAAFSGLSATTASVVRNSPAMDAAFCSAERVTLTGSATPAFST